MLAAVLGGDMVTPPCCTAVPCTHISLSRRFADASYNRDRLFAASEMLKSSSSALTHAFIFVLAIVYGPALGQSFSATATSSSTASLPATSTAPIFTYPSPVMAETPIVSFQDVMRLSWSPLENNYTATLQILCWDRDTSCEFRRKESGTHRLVTD